MRFSRSIVIFLLLAPTLMLRAGDRWNVRAMGMGRTFVAGSRGIEALSLNPANIAAPGRGDFNLGLAPFGMRVSTDMFSYDIYQEYFTGIPGTNTDGKRDPKVLTNADKEKILSSLPDRLAATRFDVDAMELGATITTSKLGGLGFAIIDHAGALLEMPKDYARFFLYGLDSAGSKYVLDGTSISAWWWREYDFSYAYHFILDSAAGRDLYVGVGVKLLRGYGTFETDHYTGSFDNRRVGSNQYMLDAQFDYLTRRSGADFLDKDKNGNYSPFPDPAGKGTGFDVGLSAQLTRGLFVAASVTDIGKIQWDKNVVQTDGRYTLHMDDPFKSENTDSLENAVKGTNHPGEVFSSSLPTMLRIGVAIQSDEFHGLGFLPGKMLVALDYNQGLTSSMGNISKPRISMGLEYRVIPFLPLRTGISLGGGDIARWAAGFGLDFHYICLDVATENFGMLFSSKNFQMFSVAAGLKIRI